MTFTPAPIPQPPPDRFRDGDFWRGPDGNLYAVGPVQRRESGMRLACTLQPTGRGVPAHHYRHHVRGWTRVSWGGRP
jgi:hypothetical protein